MTIREMNIELLRWIDNVYIPRIVLHVMSRFFRKFEMDS